MFFIQKLNTAISGLRIKLSKKAIVQIAESSSTQRIFLRHYFQLNIPRKRGWVPKPYTTWIENAQRRIKPGFLGFPVSPSCPPGEDSYASSFSDLGIPSTAQAFGRKKKRPIWASWVLYTPYFYTILSLLSMCYNRKPQFYIVSSTPSAFAINLQSSAHLNPFHPLQVLGFFLYYRVCRFRLGTSKPLELFMFLW